MISTRPTTNSVVPEKFPPHPIIMKFPPLPQDF